MMMVDASRSVVIVDDHPEFRAFAHLLLEQDSWRIVGEAADAAEAIAAVAEHRPDIVLLDVQLPDRDGFDVAAELARDPEPPAVVFMSSREASDYGERLERARGPLPHQPTPAGNAARERALPCRAAAAGSTAPASRFAPHRGRRARDRR